ncbi:MAG TPA: DUF423 domain-containing protein [Candidatus Didemnitutus sp.]|nr:DUF423 domain-containing protein [Candidatus Didemnitutus sp.]
MTSSPRTLLATAGLVGLVGVTLGALGAHALRDTLAEHGSLDTWHTAVLYQLVHALALLALAGGRFGTSRGSAAVAWAWTAGVVFFSGSLYGLALGGPRWLGPVTPLGGLCFLAGWVLLIVVAWRESGA